MNAMTNQEYVGAVSETQMTPPSVLFISLLMLTVLTLDLMVVRSESTRRLIGHLRAMMVVLAEAATTALTAEMAALVAIIGVAMVIVPFKETIRLTR